MKPKFNIGDKVKFLDDSDSLAGIVVSFSYVPESEEFRYTFGVRAYSPEDNEMKDGVKTCLESELVEVKSNE